MTTRVTAICLIFAASLITASGFARPALDAALITTDGRHMSLSDYRGKPLIVFYEDRQSAPLNRPLKSRLREWGQERQTSDAAHVIAIANLKAYNFFPVRGFAIQHVRSLERKVGVPILIDLDGTMNAPPWSLPADSSTVVLFDMNGGVVYQKTGALSDAEIKTVITALEGLLKE